MATPTPNQTSNSKIMGFIDSIKGLLGGGGTQPTAPIQDTRPDWQRQNFLNEDQWRVNNGMVTSDNKIDSSLYNNVRGYNGTGYDVAPGQVASGTPIPSGGGIVSLDKNTTAPQAPGPAAPVAQDRSRSIQQNTSALDSLGEFKQNGLNKINDALSRILGGYDAESNKNQGIYTDQSGVNTANLQRNTQSALSNAVNGRRGLFGTLSGIGGLNGSGIDLANRAVQRGANADIAGANDSFKENQTNLDTNYGDFTDADKKRREESQLAAEDNRNTVNNDVLTKKQGYYRQLSDDYSKELNNPEADHYSNLAAQLFPDLARTGVQQPLVAGAANFNQTPLAKYIGGDSGTQVRTAPAQTPGALPGLFSSLGSLFGKKKEQQ